MKRVLGWVFAIIVVAVVVFAALNWGGYSSMCFNKSEASEVVEKENEEPTDEPLNMEEDVEEESANKYTESTL